MITVFIDVVRADVGKLSHAIAMREALRGVAIHHLMKTLPRHFEKNADTAPGGGYGYAPRNPLYVERKRRKRGTDAPLVFSGETAREQRRTPHKEPAITATQYQSILRVRSPHPLKAQQWKELTAVLPRELASYQQTAAEIYTRTLKERGARSSRNRKTFGRA
jgi:hypothetical protein